MEFTTGNDYPRDTDLIRAFGLVTKKSGIFCGVLTIEPVVN